jgi:hypothetical protein
MRWVAKSTAFLDSPSGRQEAEVSAQVPPSFGDRDGDHCFFPLVHQGISVLAHVLSIRQDLEADLTHRGHAIEEIASPGGGLVFRFAAQ